MSYPNEPSISTSYTAKEQAIGDGSFPGQELDVDLEALKTAYIELLTFVKGITRSDGKLANGSVQPETLGAGITLNFEPPEAWETSRAYSVGQTTFESNVFYICTSAHTSTVFASDLSSGRWDVLVDFTTEAAAAVAARDAALLAQSAAESARDDAESARDDAQTARDTASGHATTASTQAGIASSAASTASSAATSAGVSESNAGTSETNAANDAAAAAASAVAAATFDPANFHTKVEADARFRPMSGVAPDFILENRQASGVDGGGLVVGSGNILALNTETRDTPGVVSLFANEFAVTEDCYVEWEFPLYRANFARTWLYNVTDSVAVVASEAMGMTVFPRATTDVQLVAPGWGFLEAGHTYRIECYASFAGLQGLAASTGGVERYGHIKGWAI